MNKVVLHRKSEPGGEYGFSGIYKETLIEYGFNFETNQFNTKDDEENFIDELNNICETSAYGCVFYNTDKDCIFDMLEDDDDCTPLSEISDNIDYEKFVIEEIPPEKLRGGYDELYETKDEYFIQFSYPTKNWFYLPFDVDVKDFKPELLKIVFQHLKYPFEDEYGEIDYYFIDQIYYDGVEYYDVMDDNLENIQSDLNMVIMKSDGKNGPKKLYEFDVNRYKK
jgi:hypothetical protein